eukprot:1087530-Rhodomonas_salina.1
MRKPQCTAPSGQCSLLPSSDCTCSIQEAGSRAVSTLAKLSATRCTCTKSTTKSAPPRNQDERSKPAWKPAVSQRESAWAPEGTVRFHSSLVRVGFGDLAEGGLAHGVVEAVKGEDGGELAEAELLFTALDEGVHVEGPLLPEAAAREVEDQLRERIVLLLVHPFQLGARAADAPAQLLVIQLLPHALEARPRALRDCGAAHAAAPVAEPPRAPVAAQRFCLVVPVPGQQHTHTHSVAFSQLSTRRRGCAARVAVYVWVRFFRYERERGEPTASER